MTLDKESSDRLNLLRFPLIVGVVFIHAYSTDVGFLNGTLGVSHSSLFSTFIRDLVSMGVARIAVPLFFLMSGYLFFYEFSWSIKKYKRKLFSRMNTLLIPFVFWNCITLILIYIAQSIPATQSYFSGKNALISTYGVYDYFNSIFGFDRYPISYQFWFIRDLMVMVLLVPLLQVFLKIAPTIFLGILTILWFLKWWPIYVPSSAAFVFFYLGAYIAVSEKNLFHFDKYGKFILIFYLIILFADIATKDNGFNEYLHRSGIIFGIASALYSTKVILNIGRLKSFLLWSASCSFFVFSIHEPLLTVTKKVIYKLLVPTTDLMILSLYFSIPVLVIVVSILTYKALNYLNPKFLKVVIGTR